MIASPSRSTATTSLPVPRRATRPGDGCTGPLPARARQRPDRAPQRARHGLALAVLWLATLCLPVGADPLAGASTPPNSTTAAAAVQQRVDPEPRILVPAIDTRSYRALRLANGIRAVLVSDPRTDKSAAALAVERGSFDEPADIPGLAHFLEHMLFLGTEKYPAADEYQDRKSVV